MSELIRNARLGWMDYMENGKFVALLLIALLIFWFWRREAWNKYQTLFKYTTLLTLLCICPLTAVALMLYQTKFYDYEWIWNAVPITLVISLAITLLWTERKETKGKILVGTLAMLAILYCCGSMGQKSWDFDREREQRKQAEAILENVTEKGQNQNITLWAPREIMAYARALDGDIRLPYGRNMWDPALNAYSYDTYGEQELELYEWMCQVEETGEGEVDCMETVSALGINHILLPETINGELLKQVEAYWQVTATKTGNYYWICTGE